MATVDGVTAARAQAIQDASIVSGAIVNGDLILTQYDGTTINAGAVIDPSGLVAHQGDVSTHGVVEIVGRTEPQTLTNKTLTLPVIASFLNAMHTHGDSAGGGPLSIGVASSPAPVTTLAQYTLLDGDPARVLASLTLTPGRWLILGVCEGVTLNSAAKTRFSFDLDSTGPTFYGKPVASSSETTLIDGGKMVFGWLENVSNSTIDFTITKNASGSQITNSTQGMLIAIRMG